MNREHSNQGQRSARVALLLILGLGLAIRLGWVAVQPRDEAATNRLPDQREYLEVARSLLAGEGFQFHDPRFRDIVVAFRMPGYPLFLAALKGNVLWIRVAQAVIDVSCILGVYLLARRFLPYASSLWAALFVAFNPFLVYFCGLLLSETLFTAMLVWGMYLLIRGGGGSLSTRDDISPAKAKWTDVILWLSGCLLLALSIHIRQSAMGLPLLLGIGAAFVNRFPAPAYYRKWPLPVGTTMLLFTVLVLLPWAWRNHRVLHTWEVWTTTNGGVTLYDGFNPDATGATDQSFLADIPELRSPRMNELQRDAYLRDLAKVYVKDHPVRAIQLAVLKLGRTWSPVPLSSDYGDWKYRVVGLLFSLPLDLFALLGLYRGQLPRSVKVFLLIPAIYFTAVHMLSVGSLRYRIPVEPPMAIIAASSLGALMGKEGRFLSGVKAWKRARNDREA